MNGPIVNLLFLCHITLYLEKVISYQKFSLSFTLKAKIVWKISVFQGY